MTRGRVGWCALLLLLPALAGCHGGSAERASISVTPATAVLDVPVRVSLTGLPDKADITVVASTVDGQGVHWRASAVYRSDSAGRLSLDQAPKSGSYTGSNPMGLFQFMLPLPPAPVDDSNLNTHDNHLRIQLTASAHGRQLASTTVDRLNPRAAGVIDHPYRPADSGIYADLYEPHDTSVRRPAVLVFGGSEGGQFLNLLALLLASHGYPAMSLAYFGEPGLPSKLENIPLEYFTKALAVLRAAPGADPKHLLVSGFSRGSEAALLLGAHFPDLVSGVIAGAPSSVVNPGNVPGTHPAWLLDGRPLPYVPPQEFKEAIPSRPDAVIPVERIRGPVLLDCGTSDSVWPSCSYLDAITDRLAAHHFGYPVTALRLDGGHAVALGLRYYSAADNYFSPTGGLASTDEPAEATVYAAILKLLGSLTA